MKQSWKSLLYAIAIMYAVGSVVEWLRRRARDQHGLGSKPTRAFLLRPWKRHYTAHTTGGGGRKLPALFACLYLNNY